MKAGTHHFLVADHAHQAPVPIHDGQFADTQLAKGANGRDDGVRVPQAVKAGFHDVTGAHVIRQPFIGLMDIFPELPGIRQAAGPVQKALPPAKAGQGRTGAQVSRLAHLWGPAQGQAA